MKKDGFTDFFDPMEVPKFVSQDVEAFDRCLELSGQVWEQNTIRMLMSLFSASLPATYLIEDGIQALFASGNLKKSATVPQRLYETALMIENVMRPGGIRISADVGLDWGETELQEEPKRFVWGVGYISAKKVRLLHSAMRYLLPRWATRLEATKRESADSISDQEPHQLSEALNRGALRWSKNTTPVNQADQLFTLVAFGYLMPRAVNHWTARSVRLSDDEMNACLQRWRLVGYCMGVSEELLNEIDCVAHAHRFYEWYLKNRAMRQDYPDNPGESAGDPGDPDGMDMKKGEHETGRLLTSVSVDFASSYLPTTFCINEWFASAMVIDHMGQDADLFEGEPPQPARMLLRESDVEQCRRPWPRFLYWVWRLLTRYLSWARRSALKKFLPLVGRYLDSLINRAALALFQSFRAEYDRKPFQPPRDVNDTEWRQIAEARQRKFRAEMASWRKCLFRNIGLGLICLFINCIVGIFATVALIFLGLWVLLPFMREPIRDLEASWNASPGFLLTCSTGVIVTWGVFYFLATRFLKNADPDRVQESRPSLGEFMECLRDEGSPATSSDPKELDQRGPGPH